MKYETTRGIKLFATATHAWQSDHGDGTFSNPPLYADYPDTDICNNK